MGRLSTPPADLELAFLSTHIGSGPVGIATEQGVGEDSFATADHARVWQYLVDRVAAGLEPTRGDVETLFGVKLPEVEDAEAIREELLYRTMATRARATLMEHARSLDADPIATVQQLVVELGGLRHPSKARTAITDADTDRLLSAMEQRRELLAAGNVIGIPTGWPTFDAEGETFKPGEMVAVLGKMNVGKSAVLFQFGMTAYWRAGSKVLILSPESPIDSVEARVLPMLGQYMGVELSNRAIRNGTVDPDLWERFVRQVAALNRRDLIIRDSGDSGVFTIQDVIGQIREHRPDMVIIDGFHLISSGGSETWQTMRAAAQTLKGLGQSMGFVTLAGSQVDRNSVQAADEVPEMGHSAYGLALEETADRVIHLAEVRGDEMRRVFKVSKMRDGARRTTRHYLQFDVDRGLIRQVDPQVDSESGYVSF